jgi:hypothetical protein
MPNDTLMGTLSRPGFLARLCLLEVIRVAEVSEQPTPAVASAEAGANMVSCGIKFRSLLLLKNRHTSGNCALFVTAG